MAGRKWGFSRFSFVFLCATVLLVGCRCQPPPGVGTEIPAGDNAANCECALSNAECGAECCDFGTGEGTPRECAHRTCAPISCCRPGTGNPGQPACVTAPFQPTTACCDMGTGAPSQPLCAHQTVDRVGNCNSRRLSVCLPPNTPLNAVGRYCDQMCVTHAESLAVAAGSITPLACLVLQARGVAVPKPGQTATTWADATCLGTCSTTATAACNSNGDCPITGETCSTSCIPVTCAVSPGPPRTDNFCFTKIEGSCCNVVTPVCGGDVATPVCRPNLGDPPGLLTAAFSRNSAGVLDANQSLISVTLEDGSTVTPSVNGTVDFSGQPCPGAACSVGVTLEAFVTDFTTQGATFSRMTISAGTRSPALRLQSAGGTLLTGQLDASNLTITLQGTATAKVLDFCLPGAADCLSRTVGGTQAIRSQPAAQAILLNFEIDYVNRTFALNSSAPFHFPRTGNTPAFAASLRFAGIIKNQPPRAVASAPASVECNSPTSGVAILDGTASRDPDSDLLNFSWLQGREVVGTYVGHDSVVTVEAPFVPPGPTTTEFTLQVGDTVGQVDTAGVSVEVVDTAPPELTATVTPSCLWAPNHGLVLLRLGEEISAIANDTCQSASPTVYIKGVVSNQPDLGSGQGNTMPDVLAGTAAVCLRSEREGSAAGRTPRVYTITLAAKDASGNEATRDVTVTVPHDQHGAKCPRVPSSLIVPEGDSSCTQNVPGVPLLASPAPVAQRQAAGCTTTIGSLAIWLVTLGLARRPKKRSKR